MTGIKESNLILSLFSKPLKITNCTLNIYSSLPNNEIDLAYKTVYHIKRIDASFNLNLDENSANDLKLLTLLTMLGNTHKKFLQLTYSGVSNEDAAKQVGLSNPILAELSYLYFTNQKNNNCINEDELKNYIQHHLKIEIEENDLMKVMYAFKDVWNINSGQLVGDGDFRNAVYAIFRKEKVSIPQKSVDAILEIILEYFTTNFHWC